MGDTFTSEEATSPQRTVGTNCPQTHCHNNDGTAPRRGSGCH